MSRHFVAHFLISLFTTNQRAEPITGDLVELAETRGQGWFWLQTVQTVSSLFWLRLSAAPFTVIAIVALGLGLDSAIELQYWRFVVEPFELSPQQPPGWLLYYAMLATSSAAIGFLLVLISPRLGLCACFLIGGIQYCGALIHQLGRFSGGQLQEGQLASTLLWVTFVAFFRVTCALVSGGVAGRRLHMKGVS